MSDAYSEIMQAIEHIFGISYEDEIQNLKHVFFYISIF